MRHLDVGVAVVRLGEALLGAPLVLVVELLGEPGTQLGDERGQREAAGDERGDPRQGRHGPQIGAERLPHAGVLHLDRDRPPAEHRVVHLAE